MKAKEIVQWVVLFAGLGMLTMLIFFPPQPQLSKPVECVLTIPNPKVESYVPSTSLPNTVAPNEAPYNTSEKEVKNPTSAGFTFGALAYSFTMQPKQSK